jgi:acid phosphatase family membrane protein YuiD
MKEILTNKFLWGPLFVSFTAQLLKFLINLVRQRKIDIRKFVEMGGLPSAHSASVSALTVLVGLSEGFSSPLFGVTAFFSLIVMYDAAGIRRAAGEQAKVINAILEELLSGHPISQNKLRELLGHTPFEVLTGAIMGGFMGWLIWKL